MTTAEKNAAIAEACGWVTNGVEWRKGDGNEAQDDPPDYCTDLNAMHEAERCCMLDCDNGYRYNMAIIRETTPFKFAWYATAQQRADAFLRTIGKWVD